MANVLSVVVGCLALVILAGCDDGQQHGGDADESHAASHAHGDDDGLPAKSITVWTDQTELFMEHQPLITGHEVAFAAHVTAIPSFKAVTKGSVVVTLSVENAAPIHARANQPSSPGIFRPSLKPVQTGPCRLTVVVERDGQRDEIDAGGCTVFPDEETARTTLGGEADDPGRITFLKEQQWNTDFATVAAEERELRASILTDGTIVPAAGRDSRVVAPAAGRVTFGDEPPILGAAVRKGEMLASFTPRLDDVDRASLEADAASARAESSVAEAQLTRSRGLLQQRAIPQRALDEAEARAKTARARLAATTGRLEQYDAGLAGVAQPGRDGFPLLAPIDGTLVAVQIASGEAVESGRALFRIIDLAMVWLETRVFEPDIPKVENARSGWFDVDGYDERFVFDATNSQPVTIGRVVDAQSRTVPAIFAIDNPGERLRIGQFARVSIATGAAAPALAVPESSVLDEAGKTFVYAQIDGEVFERRPVVTGIRDAGLVQVLDGIAPGERVVSKGAYDIKLAVSSGVVSAHGHAH